MKVVRHHFERRAEMDCAPNKAGQESISVSPPAWAEFRKGVVVSLPAIAAAAPFAILLGALSADKGLSVPETGLMSALVFAGSAQFIALDAWQAPPAWLAIGAGTLVVNLRHVFMSASVLRHMAAFPRWLRAAAMLFLADEIWAFAEARAARQRLTPAFYAGLVAFFYANWVISTMIGGLAGRLISDPRAWGFDFAFIAIFIGLIMGFRERPGFAVTLLASAAAAILVHLISPGPMSIAVGALAGVVAAAIAADPGHGDPDNGKDRP
ncbi:MAG TPA: AzlC family ABC transporter permease [Rhizobiaceae bacterium]|nr:AzlC family ABC transporter permease [Rhizobiaceae bacterium]